MIKGREGVLGPGAAEGQNGSPRRRKRVSPAACLVAYGLHRGASAVMATRTVCSEMFRSAGTARTGHRRSRWGSARRTWRRAKQGRHWPHPAPVRYGRRRRLRPPPGFPAGVDCYREPGDRRRLHPTPASAPAGRWLPGARSTLRNRTGGAAPHPTRPRRAHEARLAGAPRGARRGACPTRRGIGVGHGGGDGAAGNGRCPGLGGDGCPARPSHARGPERGPFPALVRRGGARPVGMPRVPAPSHAPHTMCPGDGPRGVFPARERGPAPDLSVRGRGWSGRS